VREGSGGARATMVAIVLDDRDGLHTRLTCSRMKQLVTAIDATSVYGSDGFERWCRVVEGDIGLQRMVVQRQTIQNS
jgi:hypothetical protein